ncbi:MAG TPA: FAD-dependent oxidoreductase [Candidatus Anaerotruncus excrementipullorum]|uniref:FAD-dependent oxidoreductase n=1 Tax=Candidatus Anaerotruncus excrementipullorum TaxID=2838465 RepID=A0A9D2B6E8_9FIRM|nr:FAD-dependent oxidoreductase [Candidatus Anaerotruncus excrementipullorum]
MKLVVVGGVAGGASAAARVRRLDAKAQIVMFERGEHVSFSNCCLPYYLSGTVATSDALVLMTPEKFHAQHDIDARVNTEVIEIKRAEKKVVARNLATGETYEESYDKLVLAPGANPILPRSIAGIDRANVFAVRNVTDIVKLKEYVSAAGIEKVAVVGGGFIGIETAENLKEAGKQVCVIEGTNQIMAPFDYDMVQILHKELDDHGVQLYLSTTLTAVEDGCVKVQREGKEESIPADAVVMAIGVAPETTLAKAAGLEIGETRGIKVNHNFQTSDPDIYAVGDAIEYYNALTHQPGRLALAGPAQRQARAAANHMYGIPSNNNGFIGSSCIRVFGQNAACTGLNEKAAAKAGYSFDSVLVFPPDKVGLMPGSHYMAFKLVFEVPTGRILGAQAIGQGAADKRADVLAAMITMGATLEDLKELELCYSPVFGTAKDVVNQAALVGLNVLYGTFRQVHVDQVRGLVESGAFIVDVREPNEFAAGHLNGAHNIPLSQLRQRMDEIPQDVPVYLHCRSSQRSYYALCCLAGNGYKNLYNISGSYLGISLYEYFNDKTQGRQPIMDKYNFN